MSRVHHGPRGRARDEQRIRDYCRDLARLKARGEDLDDYDVLVHEDGQVGMIVPKTKEK